MFGKQRQNASKSVPRKCYSELIWSKGFATHGAPWACWALKLVAHRNPQFDFGRNLAMPP